jgi:hypothetical protein
MKKGNKSKSGTDVQTSMKEVHADFNEFIKARETIAEMIRFKKNHDQSFDKEALDNYRHKAIDAINHLFDDELRNTP